MKDTTISNEKGVKMPLIYNYKDDTKWRSEIKNKTYEQIYVYARVEGCH